MREHPIIFNSEMARAILEGRKTMTRRPIKTVNEVSNFYQKMEKYNSYYIFRTHPSKGFEHKIKCPYGQPGDRLWVRETWAVEKRKEKRVIRKADNPVSPPEFDRWRPSIHMPKYLSRITLEITDIRVERLQEITEEDAKAEGVITGSSAMGHVFTAKEHFRALWNSLYTKKPEYQWKANPWVWVIEFIK